MPDFTHVCGQAQMLNNMGTNQDTRADGALVSKSQVQGKTTIDLCTYATGIYTFILRSNGDVRTGRVVKY